MLVEEWHLIDESYGWLALSFTTTWTTKTAQTGDELCRFRRTLSDCCEALTRTPASHEWILKLRDLFFGTIVRNEPLPVLDRL